MPNGRCRMHGGKSLSGLGSPNWKDGRRSKVLPRRMIADFQASLADENRLVLNEEIALIDTRINDVLKRVDSGESGPLWSMLRQAAHDYEAARRANDTTALVQAIALLLDLITRGHSDAGAWSEVSALVERRRRLVDSEAKRQAQTRELIHVSQALATMSLLVDAVHKHVHDRAVVRAVAGEFAKLTGRPFPMEEAPEWNA